MASAELETLEYQLGKLSLTSMIGLIRYPTTWDVYGPQVCMDAAKLLMKTSLHRGQRGTSAGAGSGWGGQADGGADVGQARSSPPGAG